MSDPIDTARQEGIALGLAMAAQKARTMLDGSGDHQTVVTMRLVFAEIADAILTLATIPPHVAAARVLLADLRLVLDGDHSEAGMDAGERWGAARAIAGGGDAIRTIRAALEQITKENHDA